MLDRQLKTGQHDLDRFCRQVGEILNGLIRSRQLGRALTDSDDPTWEIPVVTVVERLIERVEVLETRTTVLVQDNTELKARLAAVEQTLDKLLFEYGITIRVPPLLANVFAEAASEV